MIKILAYKILKPIIFFVIFLFSNFLSCSNPKPDNNIELVFLEQGNNLLTHYESIDNIQEGIYVYNCSKISTIKIDNYLMPEIIRYRTDVIFNCPSIVEYLAEGFNLILDTTIKIEYKYLISESLKKEIKEKYLIINENFSDTLGLMIDALSFKYIGYKLNIPVTLKNKNFKVDNYLEFYLLEDRIISNKPKLYISLRGEKQE